MNLTASRRTTQIAFILLVFLMPVLNIFRFDTATKELIIFGQIWSLGLKDAFYADHSIRSAGHVALRIFLKAILPWVIMLAIFPLLGFLTGRFFCGWFCPEGTLFELADNLTLKFLGRRSLFVKRPNDPEVPAERKLLYLIIALLSMIVLPLLGGIALTGYLVAPKTIWSQIMTWDFTFGVKAGIIGISIYMLVTSILVRHSLCKYICAAGLMQMLFGWVSPVSLRVRMDAGRAEECTNCRGCEKACFMNVLPRMSRRDISCVNCGACIAACHKELGRGRGLFHFQSGQKNSEAEHRESQGNGSSKPSDISLNLPHVDKIICGD
ncbi:MAG: 4Fe-4S binding protein [Nitrospirae bacterium]|nr:4Fe-4S binding protein [Nitrospirota bacterium]